MNHRVALAIVIATIVLVILASQHQHKAQPLLIQAKAPEMATIVCNPVLVAPVGPERKVQKV